MQLLFTTTEYLVAVCLSLPLLPEWFYTSQLIKINEFILADYYFKGK